MVSYGSLPALERPQGAKQRVGLLAAVGGLCAIAAICALVSISDAQHNQVVLLQASETQALADISQSDKLLATAVPHAKAPSAASLRKAALAMEQEQEHKIAKAAKKLAAEKQEEKEVKIAAHKLLARAEKAEQMKSVDARAEAKYEAAKKAAMAEAQAKIQQAKKLKEAAEKGVKVQKLGANMDPHLDMNPKQPIYHPQHDPFSDLDPPVYKKAKVTKLGANDDRFLNLNPPTVPESQHDPFSNLDPPVYKKSKVQHLAGTASAKAADEQVDELEKKLKQAKAKAAAAEKRVMQHLAEEHEEGEEEEDSNDKEYVHPDPDYKPPFYEDYYPGKLGPMGESKRIPEDHPKGHKMCRFHDIDCDELWPWGKKKAVESGPPARHGPLGDNLVGVFGQDDVVVPTEKSGLIAHGRPYVDRFDHWPEDSKKNKDLLYGTARKMIAQKYTGVGDVYVPLERLEHMQNHKKEKGQPLADFLFGSWEQGFHKPHAHDIKKHINMFDQPFRQHWSVADGNGHQVYNLRHPDAYGGPVGLGLTKGDEPEDEEFQGLKNEWEEDKEGEEGEGEEEAPAEEEAEEPEAAAEPEHEEEEHTADQNAEEAAAPEEAAAEEPKEEGEQQQEAPAAEGEHQEEAAK